MNTHRKRPRAVRRGHLSLAVPIAPMTRFSRQEVRAMLRLLCCYVGAPLACQRTPCCARS